MADVKLTPELLRAARAGDRAAIDAFGVWLDYELLNYYRARRYPAQDVRDCAQAAAADVIKKLDEAPTDLDAFHAWVWGFAGMAAKSQRTKLGREQRKRAAARVHPRSPARRVDSALHARRLSARVQVEIERLPSPFRSTFKLVQQRQSAKRAAEELGIPAATVRWRFMEARRRLLDALDRGS